MEDIARDTSPRFVPNILGSSCYTGCCKSEWTLKKLKQADCRKILQIEPKYPVECKSSNCTIRNEGYCLIFPSLPSCVNFSYFLFFFLFLNFFFPLCLYFWFQDSHFSQPLSWPGLTHTKPENRQMDLQCKQCTLRTLCMCNVQCGQCTQWYKSPMHSAQCPMPNVQFSMPNSQCKVQNTMLPIPKPMLKLKV